MLPTAGRPNASFVPPFTRPSAAFKRSAPATSRVRPVRAIPCARSREFWVEPLTPTALTKAVESSLHTFFTSAPEGELSTLAKTSPTVLSEDGSFPRGIHRTIASASDVTALTREAHAHEIVVITCADWSAIPAENLLAVYQHSPTSLFATVNAVADAEAMFEMLEIGVDGCVLSTADPAEVARFAELKHRLAGDADKVAYETARVLGVKPVGSGERVCVDTCSLLGQGEGMLVGSSSQGLFHVLSEAAECSYVASRPFRVNAGPVHSYCLLPGGKTAYLCELSAGDSVLIASADGSTRSAVVGRAKIETRPLLLVTVLTKSGEERSVFLQNAETVRLSTVDGGEPVTALTEQSEVLIRVDDVARHTGIPIVEKLTEK